MANSQKIRSRANEVLRRMVSELVSPNSAYALYAVPDQQDACGVDDEVMDVVVESGGTQHTPMGGFSQTMMDYMAKFRSERACLIMADRFW